jgi:hypothetical protein
MRAHDQLARRVVQRCKRVCGARPDGWRRPSVHARDARAGSEAPTVGGAAVCPHPEVAPACAKQAATRRVLAQPLHFTPPVDRGAAGVSQGHSSDKYLRVVAFGAVEKPHEVGSEWCCRFRRTQARVSHDALVAIHPGQDERRADAAVERAPLVEDRRDRPPPASQCCVVLGASRPAAEETQGVSSRRLRRVHSGPLVERAPGGRPGTDGAVVG